MSQNKTQTQNKPLSSALRNFFGVGDAGFVLMSNVETFYFMTFLTNFANFAPAVAGVINSVFSIIDACLSWIYGGILNGTKAKKWGRYRSWLILTPWIVPFIFTFQFIRISENEWLSAIIIIIAAVVSHVIWNIGYVANATLVSVVGKTPEDKATLSSSRATWNNIGGLVWSYAGLPFATVLGGIVGQKNQWAAAAFVLGWVMVLGYYAHFKMTEGYEEIEDEGHAKTAKQNKISIPDMFKSLFQNPQLIILMLADLAKWCVKFVTAASAIYYFRDAAGNPGLMVPYALCIAHRPGRHGGRLHRALLGQGHACPYHHHHLLHRHGAVPVPDLRRVHESHHGHRVHDLRPVLLRRGLRVLSGSVRRHRDLHHLEDRQERRRLDHGPAEPAPEGGRVPARHHRRRGAGQRGLEG